MPTWFKVVVVSILILSVSSLIWFIAGSTAYFQRGMDIVGTAYLILIAVPLLGLVLGFTQILLEGWTPATSVHHFGVFVGILLSIVLCVILIHSVASNGWTEKKIESDSLKITADGKYEYRIELINLFQSNSNARLYLKEVESEEEKYIPINIQTREINSLIVGKVNNWVILEPAKNSSRYFLSTTEKLRLPQEQFEIDVEKGSSRKLE